MQADLNRQPNSCWSRPSRVPATTKVRPADAVCENRGAVLLVSITTLIDVAPGRTLGDSPQDIVPVESAWSLVASEGDRRVGRGSAQRGGQAASGG